MPDTHFLFIGPRTDYSLKQFAKINHKRILEIDAVDINQKTSALHAADVLSAPSTQESFGGIFLEGWKANCAVIGGDAPAVRDVITDGQYGFIVPQIPRIIADKLI